MRGRHLLGLAAVAIVVAFFVPFIDIFGNVFLWELWWSPKRGWNDALSVAIASSTLALFVTTWLIAFFRPQRTLPLLGWTVWGVVPALIWGFSRQYWHVGYWFLLTSFVLLGWAVHQTRRERRLVAYEG